MLYFGGHTVLVGDNNTGKSTALEAIDLVLGPERLAKRPVIDEHDFFGGRYRDEEGKAVPIQIRVVVTDLSEEQQRHFRDHLQWWDDVTHKFLEGPPPESTDQEAVQAALQVGFVGQYDPEEDDFIGQTIFCSPLLSRENKLHFEPQTRGSVDSCI